MRYFQQDYMIVWNEAEGDLQGDNCCKEKNTWKMAVLNHLPGSVEHTDRWLF